VGGGIVRDEAHSYNNVVVEGDITRGLPDADWSSAEEESRMVEASAKPGVSSFKASTEGVIHMYLSY
jgi:hypothetical protein